MLVFVATAHQACSGAATGSAADPGAAARDTGLAGEHPADSGDTAGQADTAAGDSGNGTPADTGELQWADWSAPGRLEGNYSADEAPVVMTRLSGSVGWDPMIGLDVDGDQQAELLDGYFGYGTAESGYNGMILGFETAGGFPADDLSPEYAVVAYPPHDELGANMLDVGDVLGTGPSTLAVGVYDASTREVTVTLLDGLDRGEWPLELGRAVFHDLYVPTWPGSHGPGDLTGDGVPDVVLADPLPGGTDPDAGAWLVFSGDARGDLGRDDRLAAVVDDPDKGTFTMDSVDYAGDLDGDGMNDLVVGDASRGTGLVYVFSGPLREDLRATTDYTARIQGSANGLGYEARALGDTDGDGYGDLAASARYDTTGSSVDGTFPGAVYAWLGPVTGDQPEGDADVVLTGRSFQTQAARWGSALGWVLAAPGDLDGDGHADLAAGAIDETRRPGANDGAVWLYYGPLRSGVREADPDAAVYAGDDHDDLYGVAGVGDITGDGLPDLVLTDAHHYEVGYEDPPANHAFLVAGRGE